MLWWIMMIILITTDKLEALNREQQNKWPSNQSCIFLFKTWWGNHKLCVEMDKTMNNSHCESLRGLHTWAGFVAPPTLRSALSPPSATAGWSVYGKRDKTAICVALSHKNPSFKTFCGVQNKPNSPLMVSTTPSDLKRLLCNKLWWESWMLALLLIMYLSNIVLLSAQCSLSNVRIGFRPRMRLYVNK